jgi:hypothetical protein
MNWMRPPINTYDQLQSAVASGLIAESQAIAISPSRLLVSSRSSAGPPQNGWILYSPYFKTDLDAPWYYHGQKVFLFAFATTPKRVYSSPADLRRARKQGALDDAIAYCRQAYGHADWKRNRIGAWVPAAVELAFPIPKNRPTLPEPASTLGPS